MGFSSDAVGFFLEAEDRLSPALKVAARNYQAFTKTLAKENQRANRLAAKGMGAFAHMTKAFDMLPKRALAGYRKALSAIQRDKRTIRQPIDFVFNQKSLRDGLAKAVAAGVSKALSRMSLRLRPQVPKGRVRGFSTAGSLSRAYREQVQPPDLVGKANIPKFNKGGLVRGGRREGIDDVVAMLGKGEMVLPAKAGKILRDAAKVSKMKGGKGIAQSYADLENLTRLLPKLADAAALGLDPKAAERYAKAMEVSQKAVANLQTDFGGMTKVMQGKLGPEVEALKKNFNETSKAASSILRKAGLLAKALGPVTQAAKSTASATKFIGALKAMNAISNGVQRAREHVGRITGGKDGIQSFFDNMNTVNRSLGLSRDELAGMRSEMIAMTAVHPAVLTPTIMGEAADALANAGARTREEFTKLLPIIGLATNAMRMTTDEASGLARMLGTTLGMTGTQTADLFAMIDRMEKRSGVGGGTIAASMTENIDRMGSFLTNMDAGGQSAVLTNMSALTAAMHKNFGDSGGKMAEMMSSALGNGMSEEATSLTKLTGLTGGSDGTLAKALQNGEMEQIITGIQRAAASAQGNSTQGSLLASALGFSGTPAEFSRFAKNSERMIGDLNELRTSSVGAGQGMGELATSGERALSTIDQFSNKVTNVFYGVFGDFIGLLQEFNPMVLASYAYLGKLAFGLLKFAKIGAVFVGFGAKVMGVLGIIGTGLAWVGGVLATIAGAIISIPGLIVAAVIAALASIYIFWDEIVFAVGWWKDAAIGACSAVGTFFKDTFTGLKDWFTGWWDTIAGAISKVTDTLGGAKDKIVNFFGGGDDEAANLTNTGSGVSVTKSDIVAAQAGAAAAAAVVKVSTDAEGQITEQQRTNMLLEQLLKSGALGGSTQVPGRSPAFAARPDLFTQMVADGKV